MIVFLLMLIEKLYRLFWHDNICISQMSHSNNNSVMSFFRMSYVANKKLSLKKKSIECHRLHTNIKTVKIDVQGKIALLWTLILKYSRY